MTKTIKMIWIVACFLVFSRSGLADSILVGTDLSTATQGGVVLCPEAANCYVTAEQFTLLMPVVIDDIKVVMSGPADSCCANESFSVGLGSQIGSVRRVIGSGNVISDLKQNITTEAFDFENLNISLGPGTYYLYVSGLNVMWDYAQPLPTSAGALGQDFVCDPTPPWACNGPSIGWQVVHSNQGQFAMEIDGTTVPEPSSWLLFGTGLLAVCGIARRKSRHLIV